MSNFVKAIIMATEGKYANVPLEVMFNPKEVSIDKTVPWNEHQNSQSNQLQLEFTAAKPMSFGVELTFDTFEIVSR